ncbi:MAG: flagellin FliC5 [Lachnospiraceae bacterium]|nr:flagellin FliC5 [Lachnospiraceae bacterium]
MGISAIGGYGASNYYSMSLASGKKINRAADGASEMAILQKEESQVRAYDAGADNISEGKNALNIADGALSQVTDYLQRMRELGVKASNGLLSQSDKQSIQAEIDQLKQGITDIAGMTNYNERNLIGRADDPVSIAMDMNGTGKNINFGNAALDALGIEDFDVTGSFDLSAIDKALESINTSRSTVGAQTNALEYAYNSNRNTAYNLTSGISRMGDTEYGDYVSKLQKQHTLDTYRLMMQKKQMDNKQRNVTALFT